MTVRRLTSVTLLGYIMEYLAASIPPKEWPMTVTS